jgi:pimeloyl-ACP methyl ester carboxylesterase
MSAILLDDEIVHYEVLGRGKPILFLHGWVGSWRYWIPAMQAASMSFRTYALDLWGFGDSAKHLPRYTLEQQVRLVDTFMNEMGMMRVALVGHGLGALVGTMFAWQNPQAVDRLMAVACPLEDGMISQRLRNSAPGDMLDWLLGKAPAPTMEAVRTDAPKADPQAIQVPLRLVPQPFLRDSSLHMTTPRLLVYGLNDPAVEIQRTSLLDELPEQTHQVLFEQSGHFPMLEEGSKFNRLLNDFLSLAPGESPRQLQVKEEWKRRVR